MEIQISVDQCQILQLPKITDARGNLTFIESDAHVPFAVKRVYYLYDVPGGASRAGHAHIRCDQFLIAISGSFDVTVDDGFAQKRFHLNRSYYGLHIPPMLWREIDNFSSGSVCLTLASTFYSEADYYRDYATFLQVVRGPSWPSAPLPAPGAVLSSGPARGLLNRMLITSHQALEHLG